MDSECSLPNLQELATCHYTEGLCRSGMRSCRMVRKMARFKVIELLGYRSNRRGKDHPLSSVRDFLFNMFDKYWRPFLHQQPEDTP
jgi:hypothetical protein